MVKRIFFRIFIAVMFAVPFGLVVVAGAQADVSLQDEPTDPTCQDCHPSIYAVWEDSHHGQADIVITCEACHAPLAKNHPDQPMPMDRSENLCGTCHQGTVLEWQVSHHYSAELSCVDCHGQHSTTLKAEDTQSLCDSCHSERVSEFTHSAHSTQGLLCADCHLSRDEGGEHADHSFHVKLSTCTECHENAIHTPVEAHVESEEPMLDAMASATNMGVSVDPDPISPIYYALISALVGMAFGLLVAPWIERWYHRLNENNHTDGSLD
jgi:hypothetical protein